MASMTSRTTPRIVLVNPPPFQRREIYDTPNFPRIALASLAAYLRERHWDVQVLDCKFDLMELDEAVRRIMQLTPQIIGVTAMTNEIKQAASLVELLKQQIPEITALVGGIHVSSLPEQTLREFPAFDFGVLGEGEETLHAWLTQWSGATPITTPGVCWIDEEKNYHTTGPRPMLPDLDLLPMPAWDLFRPAEFYIIQSSRGCPFSCQFCTNQWGRKVRARDPEKVLDELAWLADHMAPPSIFFADEIFTIHRKRAETLLQGMIARQLHKRLSWECQTHVNAIDEDLARLMRESNCGMVGLGIESGNEITLKNMGKGITKQRILDAAQALKQAKLPFTSFFILGQPDETPNSARETVRFAVELNPTVPVFGIMVPYPGTRIWHMMEQGEGGYIRTTSDWNDFNKQIGNAVTFVGISRRQMEWMQLLGYLKVFIYNGRILDLMRFARTYYKTGLAVLKKILLSLTSPGRQTQP
ncbi:MAG: B12-binding domain-containing radical SAM protein [Magnetococcales bacterium]|nr:B12-binding domain-containing radical SAM protein [Magnetococcales bacterium]